MTRTLVVAPQWIGDAVMSEPLLRDLARRGHRLAVAALPWVAPVYQAMPQVGEVLVWPFAHGRLDWSARRTAAAALRGRFDAACVLPNSLKAALVPWLAGIPLRVGYRGEGRVLLLNRRLANRPGRPPMVAFYRALGTLLEADTATAADIDARPRLAVGQTAIEAATQRAGVAPGRYLAFAPGAEFGPAKRWPVAHYAELAGRLHRRDGHPIVLLGSAKEAALCDAIAAAAQPGACRVLAGRTSLADAIALVAAAAGVVSNDSGLMHVAAACGVAQVAVFGSTSPEHTPPLNPRARVLWLGGAPDLPCIPCFERTCRYGHLHCLTRIAPAAVEAALQDVDVDPRGRDAAGPEAVPNAVPPQPAP